MNNVCHLFKEAINFKLLIRQMTEKWSLRVSLSMQMTQVNLQSDNKEFTYMHEWQYHSGAFTQTKYCM